MTAVPQLARCARYQLPMDLALYAHHERSSSQLVILGDLYVKTGDIASGDGLVMPLLMIKEG